MGLIGGSMARTIKAKTEHRVLGFDLSKETMKAALEEGAVDGELTPGRLAECELLLAALRPQALIDYIKEHSEELGSGTTLVDLCGIKRRVCEELEPLAKETGVCFVGGHPMAGMEKRGFGNSTERLFRHASMILVPDEETPDDVKRWLEDFFLSLGFGKIQYATAEEHDRIIAYTSQLAHVLSSAYVKTPTALSHCGFSAGSFKDMTRVATLDEDMWTELFLDNQDYLLMEVEGLINRLTPYAEALRSRDETKLRELLRDGRLYKARAEELKRQAEEDRKQQSEENEKRQRQRQEESRQEAADRQEKTETCETERKTVN